MNDLTEELNPRQNEAVTYGDGALLVLAGAGSGKTRVITHRIAYLIRKRGVNPHRIMAVTFTNKAAREMKERVEALLGRELASRGLLISTFHSAAARMLRRYGGTLGYTANFTIYDEKDQDKLIEAVAKEINLPEEATKERLKGFLEHYKASAILPGEETKRKPETLEDMADAHFFAFYRRYQQRLFQNDAMDFGDLIINFRRLLLPESPVAEEIKGRFLHILVDEFQDTNTAQYLLLKALLGNHKNIFAVGDDDQSIYRWRGAQVGNILRFPKEFAPCKVITLEENYRSTRKILNGAKAVISNNRKRHQKSLTTNNVAGEDIALCYFSDSSEEARFISAEIKDLNSSGIPLSQIALLYRIGSISRILEESLVHHSIPYRVVGNVRFYERKEIKDALSYLRLILNPSSEIDFSRAAMNPPRGIGEKTLEWLRQTARKNNCSVYSVARNPVGFSEKPPAGAFKVAQFVALLDKWREVMKRLNPAEAVKGLLKESGLLTAPDEKDDIEAARRRENLEEFVSAVESFCERRVKGEGEEDSGTEWLYEFLETTSLDGGDEEGEGERREAVSLMTVHSAKGLEFDTVFITAAEEGIFPHSRSIKSESEFEEERRLFYVAMTRAKRKLYILSSESRIVFGDARRQNKSSFIDELPRELCEFRQSRDEELERDIKRYERASRRGRQAVKRAGNKSAPLLEEWVHHPKFGDGVVKFKEGSGANARLHIYFPSVGLKRIVASFVEKKR
ncbi:MAG: DNA helicase PcrA [Myxococcota bacterium]